MTLSSIFDPPEKPEPAPAARPDIPSQLGIQLVDTPQGQRLAITLSLLLPAAEAKQFAAAITQAANGMSATGLVIAGGTVRQ